MIESTSIWGNVSDALSSTSLWSAVIRSVAIILLGFFLTKKGIFQKEMPKVLTNIVLVVALPCLALTGFMTNVTAELFQSAILSFFWGFVIYIIFILLSKPLFSKYESTRGKVLEILFVFGSTTFFGQPLISAIFPDAIAEGNMFNIAYRVFLYSYAYIAIAGTSSDSAKVDVKDILKKNIFKSYSNCHFCGLCAVEFAISI